MAGWRVGSDGKPLEAVREASVRSAGGRQRGPRRDAREGAGGQRGLDAFGECQEAAVHGGKVNRGAPHGAPGATPAGGEGSGVQAPHALPCVPLRVSAAVADPSAIPRSTDARVTLPCRA